MCSIVQWSFGVTCWEVFSFGEEPLPWSGPLFPHQISGERRETGQASQCCLLPENVGGSEQLTVCHCAHCVCTIRYDVMKECWERQSWKRPSFSQLVTVISTSLEGMAGYLDLNSPPLN